MNESHYDIVIIGGGINGTGIAADAAGRGLNVLLCEKDDLANATSSASTKLIHGGLRYLEQYSFRLVREALLEREILLHKAPFLIQPLEFVLPYESHMRPQWLLRTGLFIYDHLARHSTIPNTRKINLLTTAEGQPLKPFNKVGYAYYDCRTDDARLTVLNAIAARDNGAKIFTRTACISAKRINNEWQITLQNNNSQEIMEVRAKALINTAGPWTLDILNQVTHTPTHRSLQLVKGSHIIVPKLYQGEHAYILQNADHRIVFVIPYQDHYSLIGTTDISYQGDPGAAQPSEQEIAYLCNTVNYYFSSPINANDIIWCYSGVRPLYDDHSRNPSKITREYYLEINDAQGHAPILSVFGGKLTTFRTLAESVLKKLKPYFPHMGSPWTAHKPLPGGQLDGKSLTQFILDMQKQYHWLPSQTLLRYVHSYGDMTHALLANIHQLEQMGQNLGADLYEREVQYLIENEWAQTAEDILWRRTKLGLQLPQDIYLNMSL